jgi:hypothetical protein
MHGPEHHFLVPAVLLAAYCNVTGLNEKKSKTDRDSTGAGRDDQGGRLWVYG